MLSQNCPPVAAEIMQSVSDNDFCGVGTLEKICLISECSESDIKGDTKGDTRMTIKGEYEDFLSVTPDSTMPSSGNCPNLRLSDSIEPVLPTIRQNQVPPPTGDRGKARGRRRSRWRLKFHHQALPPEYLDHYEASIAHLDNININTLGRTKLVSAAATAAVTALGSGKLANSNTNKMKHGTDGSLPNIKLEPDSVDATYQMKNLNNTLLEQLCKPVTSESGALHRLQDLKLPDDSSASEKRGSGKLICDKFLIGKGLLGSLLSEKDLSGNINNYDDRKKRSSVIASSSVTSSSGSGGNSSCIANSVDSQGSKIVNYQDLPYMGEITLDNMKPRRGRKPKKADICHLIYKNYGTIFQGGPKTQEKELQSSLPNAAKVKPENGLISSLRCKAIDSLKSNAQMNHTDVQNRIISSLLEKRLTAATQDSRKTVSGSTTDCLSPKMDDLTRTNAASGYTKRNQVTHDEPLNLCVKDLNQLKIRLLRKHGNFYEPTTNETAVKNEYGETREQEADVDDRPDSSSLGSLGCIDGGLSYLNDQCSMNLQPPSSVVSNTTLPGGYVYWPNAGVFVHPMALQSQLLYYQKMSSIPLVPVVPNATVSTDHVRHAGGTQTISSHHSSPSSPTVQSASKTSVKPTSNKPLVPKTFSMIMEPGSKTTIMPSELSFPRMKRLTPSTSLPAVGSPAKRKRSAIFIPPMPSENNANPTTEVSICKFKFTGGAKPSLQEKKMLSVDSGGNFRYYSGTGDKSMRGYEFFPRESLQQTGNNVGSSSEHFLTASAMGSGEKIAVQIPSPIDTCTKSQSPNVLSMPGEQSSSCVDHAMGNLRHESELTAVPGSLINNEQFRIQDEESNSQLRLRRKRKTRKSLAREKLEQTFKEKGFLIQTQQLESAEGATYCKFRQLRKFTRYLFRSWKDYLPGNVREMSVAAGVGGHQESEQDLHEQQVDHQDIEEERSSCSPPTSLTFNSSASPSDEHRTNGQIQ